MELSENVWLDESTNTVIVGIERISVAFEAEEFWDFCLNIREAMNKISKHSNFVIGEYSEDGESRTTLMIKSDDPDFN